MENVAGEKHARDEAPPDGYARALNVLQSMLPALRKSTAKSLPMGSALGVLLDQWALDAWKLGALGMPETKPEPHVVATKDQKRYVRDMSSDAWKLVADASDEELPDLASSWEPAACRCCRVHPL